jgi:glycerate 2-kinase
VGAFATALALTRARAAAGVRGVDLQVSLSGSTLTVFETAYDLDAFDEVVVVGAGKASAQMAEAVLGILGERVTKGHVVTKYDHTNGAQTGVINVSESGHPVPDQPGVEGGGIVMDLAQAATDKTLVIACMSGGGSALLVQPAEGLTLEDMAETNERLLESGADITLMNTVRKHLSAVKGGNLAMAAAPATVVSLLLSDIVGDPLDMIASGPTVPDTSTFQDCWQIVEDFKLAGKLPPRAEARLRAGLAGEIPETPKAGNPVFDKCQTVVVGNNALAVAMAEERAQALGYSTLVLSTLVEGEAREVAKMMCGIAKEVRVRRPFFFFFFCFFFFSLPLPLPPRDAVLTGGDVCLSGLSQVPLSARPVAPPCCIIIGGETTVTLRGKGKGGRNQEIALAAAREIAGYTGMVVLSAGTDGTGAPLATVAPLTNAARLVACAPPPLKTTRQCIYHRAVERGEKMLIVSLALCCDCGRSVQMVQRTPRERWQTEAPSRAPPPKDWTRVSTSRTTTRITSSES